MLELENAKNRLKTALDTLKKYIEARFVEDKITFDKRNELEIENNELRSKILLLKKELLELKSKNKSLVLEQEQKSIISNDAELTLSELKAIAGGKSGAR